MVEGSTPRSIIFYTESVLEFWIDNEPFFGGDLYAYRRAPLVLPLKPGNHRLDIRLVRDVRIMGVVGEPQILIKLEAQESALGLAIRYEKLLVPDVVAGKLASSFACIPVCNEGREWIEIWKIVSIDVRTHVVDI